MKEFKNVVSLGSFCSPAMEIERISLRKRSYPFDWLICPSFETVVDLIENKFNGFLSYESFYQMKKHPAYYRNVALNIDFYHDFSMYKSIDKQFEAFKTKYERRISRFYKDICEPTLFLRYVTSYDVEYIESNHEKIEALLKSFNPQNKLIYIQNKGESAITKGQAYVVEKDEGDSVARQFLKKAPELLSYLLENVEPAESMPKKKSRFVKKLKSIIRRMRKKLGWYYHHHKAID